MQNLYAIERKVAIHAARTAANLCEKVRQQHIHAITKSDKSPVTIGDFGAQAIICRALEDAFPNDPIVAEEDATELRTSEMTDCLDQIAQFVQNVIQEEEETTAKKAAKRPAKITPQQVADWIDRGNATGLDCERFWTLDPIDGTKGFLRPNGQYAVALSLIEKGKVRVGVLACPAFSMDDDNDDIGWLFVAVQGQGAFRIPFSSDYSEIIEIPIKVCGSNETKVNVNENRNNEEMRFVESVESAHGNQEQQGKIARVLGFSTENSLRMDSQAKYAAVAAGCAALYLRLPSHFDRRENIWDHAAGIIIVEEAGGKVTDKDGKILELTHGARLENNSGVVVSNGFLHDKVLEALQLN